jgi:hypothetical protein
MLRAEVTELPIAIETEDIRSISNHLKKAPHISANRHQMAQLFLLTSNGNQQNLVSAHSLLVRYN